jgi:NAD(P)H-hydrate epimerase
MKIVSSAVMREIDRLTIEGGLVPGFILMERAGQGAAVVILNFALSLHEKFRRRYVILCGKGNNGGDGYVIARELSKSGYAVQLLSVCAVDELPADARAHAKLLPGEVEFLPDAESWQPRKGDLLIDCLLGTGLKSALREPYISLVKKINESGCAVAAVDIASGLQGDTGEILGVAVRADFTATIGLPKKGLFCKDGPAYTGRLRCIDIGFPEEIIARFPGAGQLITEVDAAAVLARRNSAVHKYQCGYVLVVGGSRNYSGAPLLAAEAAARAGAGMVSVATPGPLQRSCLNSLIHFPLSADANGAFSLQSAGEVDPFMEKPAVVVVGPGMTGGSTERALIEKIFASEKIIVADAGALLHIAGKPSLLRRRAQTVLTPHAGELKRLCAAARIECGPQAAAMLAKKWGCTVLEKGQFSRLHFADGRSQVNSSGSVALATAGSGDVLAGVMGALVSESGDFEGALAAAVFAHGLCGERSRKGARGAVADDFVDLLPAILQELSPFG